MKIRAITLFIDPSLDEAQIAHWGEFARTARQTYESKGFAVQTVRLATSILPSAMLLEWDGGPPAFAVALERMCQSHGLDYVSLGPAGRDLWHSLPEILAATKSVFVTINTTDRATGTIMGEAIHGAARVIRRATRAEPDGFANLRFAALSNVNPGTPFFPAAYHGGGPPTFAIATEAADLAVTACADTDDAETARWRLIAAIEKQAKQLVHQARKLSQAHEIGFGGIDFSLAPFPLPETSIGAALERLSGQPLGSAGSLTAAAVLTDAIDRAQFPRCGFSGLMLPVLEDNVLAARVAEGRLGISDLLQWSAMCGAGLDTVPLPGDASEQALAALLFDVAALSVRLRKPLAARLMPIPDKVVGDLVHFDFSYFTDSRVMALSQQDAPSLLTRTPELRLAPRFNPMA